MLAKMTKATSLISELTSRPRVSLLARRRIRLVGPATEWLHLLILCQPFENPDATFVRSITYRSTDGHRFDNLSRQITDLKKEVNKREQQKKELADVIEQDVLVEMRGRRPHKLPEVFVRPAPDGKRLPGEVEIHQNGLRYQSPLGTQKIGKLAVQCLNSSDIRAKDILFSNVKHLFFQPCDHELLVILHVHLKAPIMIGKKKTYVRPPFLHYNF